METNEIIARANEAVQEIYEKMGRIESCEAALKALDGAEVYIGRDKNEILDLHAALNDDQIADIMTNIHTVIKTQIDKAADELSIMCGKDARQQHEPEQCKTEQHEQENRVLEQCEPEKQEIEQNVPEQNKPEQRKAENNENEKQPESGCTGQPEKQGLESLTLELFGDKSAKKLKEKAGKPSKSTLSPDEEEKLLRELYVDESRTVKEIADIMGLTKSNIYDRIKKYGLRNKRYDGEWEGFAYESAKRN